LLGTTIAALVYILCTAVVLGLLPATELAKSHAPFADAARLLWGNWASYLIAAAAAISCFGAVNGWILINGQFPQAVARDGLFPAFFARESARGTPALGLLMGAVIGSVAVLMNFSRGMVAMFTFLVLLTTLACVVGYLFCAMADIVLARRAGRPLPWRDAVLACLAFAFCVWAVIGAGEDAVFWNFVLMLVGLPLYVWQMRSARAVEVSR
jgi:APA family basic amino acid/polyamine antiporter